LWLRVVVAVVVLLAMFIKVVEVALVASGLELAKVLPLAQNLLLPLVLAAVLLPMVVIRLLLEVPHHLFLHLPESFRLVVVVVQQRLVSGL
jgi:hypothetical protein